MTYICHGGRRENMKKGIHPEYVDTKVTCACGNTFTVKSNKEELHLEVCNECHPFYKGGKDSGLVSKTGRVEKFNRKYGFTSEAK
jgi:large subunit ribosomal protein L31